MRIVPLASSLALLLVLPLSGCLGADGGGAEEAEGLDTGPEDHPGHDDGTDAGGGGEVPFEAGVVFRGRLEATGVGGSDEATFEVPEGASRLTLRADDADDVAAGRFQLRLESPGGKEWLVYGGHGYRSPVNGVFVGVSEETVETRAYPGTWKLSVNTDGHADLGVVVDLS